jgi:hypothetical protein
MLSFTTRRNAWCELLAPAPTVLLVAQSSFGCADMPTP